jgi:hypothetical protein
MALLVTAADDVGRESTRTLVVAGSVAVHEAVVYNRENKMAERRTNVLGVAKVTK